METCIFCCPEDGTKVTTDVIILESGRNMAGSGRIIVKSGRNMAESGRIIIKSGRIISHEHIIEKIITLKSNL